MGGRGMVAAAANSGVPSRDLIGRRLTWRLNLRLMNIIEQCKLKNLLNMPLKKQFRHSHALTDYVIFCRLESVDR